MAVHFNDVEGVVRAQEAGLLVDRDSKPYLSCYDR